MYIRSFRCIQVTSHSIWVSCTLWHCLSDRPSGCCFFWSKARSQSWVVGGRLLRRPCGFLRYPVAIFNICHNIVLNMFVLFNHEQCEIDPSSVPLEDSFCEGHGPILLQNSSLVRFPGLSLTSKWANRCKDFMVKRRPLKPLTNLWLSTRSIVALTGGNPMWRFLNACIYIYGAWSHASWKFSGAQIIKTMLELHCWRWDISETGKSLG